MGKPLIVFLSLIALLLLSVPARATIEDRPSPWAASTNCGGVFQVEVWTDPPEQGRPQGFGDGPSNTPPVPAPNVQPALVGFKVTDTCASYGLLTIGRNGAPETLVGIAVAPGADAVFDRDDLVAAGLWRYPASGGGTSSGTTDPCYFAQSFPVDFIVTLEGALQPIEC